MIRANFHENFLREVKKLNEVELSVWCGGKRGRGDRLTFCVFKADGFIVSKIVLCSIKTGCYMHEFYHTCVLNIVCQFPIFIIG